MVCPRCGGAVSVIPENAPRARPGRASNPHAAPQMPMRKASPKPRLGTPQEALAQSSAWIPEPDPGPSPDAVSARISRRPDRPGRPETPGDVPDGSLALAAATDNGSAWIRSPLLWGGVACLIVVLGVMLVILLRGRSTPPVQVADSSESQPASKTDEAASPAPVSSDPAPVSPAPVSSDPAPSDSAPSVPVMPQHLAAVRPPPPVEPARRTVDLLPLIDPTRDALNGHWHSQPDGVVSDNVKCAKIHIRYQPPEEYDFRIEFTRLSGKEDVCEMFTHGGHSCVWLLGGWQGTIAGFHQVGGKDGNKNPTTVHDFNMSTGERHTALVEVRKDSIAGYLDGNLLARYETDGSDLGVKSNWDVGPNSLGIGSYISPTVFHVVELIEIGGKGHPLDPATQGRPGQ